MKKSLYRECTSTEVKKVSTINVQVLKLKRVSIINAQVLKLKRVSIINVLGNEVKKSFYLVPGTEVSIHLTLHSSPLSSTR